MILQNGTDTLIEVDGGVGLNNATELIHAGADVLVAGNAVFASADPAQTIIQIKEAGAK
jgi:ribulose-phosphate 3-epimerase